MKLEVKYFNSITPFAKQWIDKSRRVVYNLGDCTWGVGDATIGRYFTTSLSDVAPHATNDNTTVNFNTTLNNIVVSQNRLVQPNVDHVIAIDNRGFVFIKSKDLAGMTSSEIKAYMNGIYISWVSEPVDEFKWLSQNQYYLNHNYGIVDLGTLTWGKNSSVGHERFYSNVKSIGLKPAGDGTKIADLTCQIYTASKVNDIQNHNVDKAIGAVYISANEYQLQVYDSDKMSMTAAEFKSSMSGVYLIYELEKPRKYGTVNLGDLTYTKVANGKFYAGLEPLTQYGPGLNVLPNKFVLAGYEEITAGEWNNASKIGITQTINGVGGAYRIGLIVDSSIDSTDKCKALMSGKQLIFLINDEDYDILDTNATWSQYKTDKMVQSDFADVVEPSSNIYNYKYKFGAVTPNGTYVNSASKVRIYDNYFAETRTQDEINNYLKQYKFVYKKKVEEP